MNQTPANRTPSFLACLRESCDGAPEVLTKIVDKAINVHNFSELIRFYEIRNPTLATDILKAVVQAASNKLAVDVEASVVGHKTLENLITHAVAFGIIAGAHLAKEREL